MRKHVSLNVSLFARKGNICCRNIYVSDFFFQKNFVTATNVSPFARRGNNVDWILWSHRLYFLNCACANLCFKGNVCRFNRQGNNVTHSFARPRNITGNNVFAGAFTALTSYHQTYPIHCIRCFIRQTVIVSAIILAVLCSKV